MVSLPRSQTCDEEGMDAILNGVMHELSTASTSVASADACLTRALLALESSVLPWAALQRGNWKVIVAQLTYELRVLRAQLRCGMITQDAPTRVRHILRSLVDAPETRRVMQYGV